ncbi:hypothetical protein ACHAXA_003928 [Cyclostephanos tholiformis]|uniref:Uncharacterized protein n=1 Tax=Cyclostephanos tholiformis TaxID=382380 RepID=A0ABD3RTE1_9STRA
MDGDGQKVKTKDYWDSFYSSLPSAGDINAMVDENLVQTSSSALEWIVPYSAVLETISSIFPQSNQAKSRASVSVNVLEIGCGVSQLSLTLLQRLLLNRQDADPCDDHRAYCFVATDISPICIEHNRIRDDSLINSLDTADGSLGYELLDVLDDKSSSAHHRSYDIILDKGTLDTFLFRSKRKQKGSSSHPPLLKPLLNNVHRWLRTGYESKYVVISPRPKIKSLRDFRGFASVRRIKVDASTLIVNNIVLVTSNNEKSKTTNSDVYLYECVKDDSYNPDDNLPYRGVVCDAEDEFICVKCGMSFKHFRGTVNVKDQGEVVWSRRWKNHVVHCKG